MTTQRLEEELECPICFDRFNIPKLLPCQHTFCAHCLEGLNDRGSVKCPECRLIHPIPANGFPINITMQRLLSASEVPNVPTINVPESGTQDPLQPTAPPLQPPPSRLPPVYPTPDQQVPEFPAQYHDINQPQHPGLHNPQANYPPSQITPSYVGQNQHPSVYVSPVQPLPSIQPHGERNMQPSTLNSPAARTTECGNNSEDGNNFDQCKTIFLKYFSQPPWPFSHADPENKSYRWKIGMNMCEFRKDCVFPGKRTQCLQFLDLKFVEITREAVRKVISSFLRKYKNFMAVTTVIFLVITFSRFVAGAVKLSSDCTKEQRVAQYLFVKSWFAFVFWGMLLLLGCKKQLMNAMDNPFVEVYIAIESLFSFIWLIVGTVWAIGFRGEMIDECPLYVEGWNKHFINFALFLTAVDWIGIVAFVFYCCYVKFDRSDRD